jgi:NAD(P)-dependent dehydrogenase (short-subunit alcohol dehydrogenase family)
MKLLEDHVVLITGAAGQMGQALTRAFLHSGSHIILSDLSTEGLPHGIEEVFSDASTSSPHGTILGAIGADLSTRLGCDLLFERCQTVSPRVDILINNAGIGLFAEFMDIPEERWEEIIQVDLLAPMRLTARFLPDMIKRGRGHIVNMSSVAGLVGFWRHAPYSAAKFGLRGFGEALYADVWRHGIRITTIYPSLTGNLMSTKEEAAQVPRWQISDPDFIVSELLKGIKEGRRHVYPGTVPKLIDSMSRMVPWVFPLNRFHRFEWVGRRPSALATGTDRADTGFTSNRSRRSES